MILIVQESERGSGLTGMCVNRSAIIFSCGDRTPCSNLWKRKSADLLAGPMSHVHAFKDMRASDSFSLTIWLITSMFVCREFVAFEQRVLDASMGIDALADPQIQRVRQLYLRAVSLPLISKSFSLTLFDPCALPLCSGCLPHNVFSCSWAFRHTHARTFFA